LAANVLQFFWHRAWFWWVMIFAVSCECAISATLLPLHGASVSKNRDAWIPSARTY
jgi:hypothetical protein